MLEPTRSALLATCQPRGAEPSKVQIAAANALAGGLAASAAAALSTPLDVVRHYLLSSLLTLPPSTPVDSVPYHLLLHLLTLPVSFLLHTSMLVLVQTYLNCALCFVWNLWSCQGSFLGMKGAALSYSVVFDCWILKRYG